MLLNTRVQQGSCERPHLLTNPAPACSACEMVGEFVSVDQVTQVQYISCHLPLNMPQLTAWLQHVCVRSLSCEVNPCLFCEQENCVMSVSFSVRDAMSRGFYRWFSVVVTMRDLTLLAASCQFLYKIIDVIISRIQEKALQVYNLERPFRFNNPPQSRSLVDLTRSKHVFAWLHRWFAWLLRVQSRYFHERILSLPHRQIKMDLNIDVGDFKSLRSLLTRDIFTHLVLGLIEGKQIIVRGDSPSIVESTVNTLKMILPKSCCKSVSNSDDYIEPADCNLLGVTTQVAVPRPSHDILRVDILRGSCVLKTLASSPARYPTLLNKFVKALDNNTLTSKALGYHVAALKQEWINICGLLSKVHPENSPNLLMALGVQEPDRALIKFWSKNIT